ncbi:hypothetical protein KB221_07465 [Aquidulcibacter paucihalophilus]|nr:hypothetical protein KB221_07465 [Aquidulcibacter paucihalophilus]
MERAISRQAVAEWRDRQILAAAALLNQKSIDARAAFDREVETATAAETIFNPSALANSRIDALMGASLSASLPEFLGIAARELASIDQRLGDISDTLSRPDLIALPLASSPLPAATAVVEVGSDNTSEPEDTQPQKRGISRVSAMLVKRASSLADGAGSAADDLLQDKLGLKNRLRSAATQRIAQSWMGGTGEPRPVLAQLVSLIDDTTHAARMSLS